MCNRAQAEEKARVQGHVNGSPMFAPVVERTKANGFDVREVSTDKAYLSHENLARAAPRRRQHPRQLTRHGDA